MDNIIYNGVILEFKTIGLNELNRVSQIFNRTKMEAQEMARDVPESINAAFAPLANLKSILNRDLTKPFRTAENEIDKNFENISTNIRRLKKGYYDFIMGGVAIAMSGLGIRRVGNAITRTINSWVDASMEFNMVMKQVQVLGQVTGKEYEKLRKKIIQVGIDLPGSNLEAAQAALMGLKTGFTADEVHNLTEYVAKMVFLSEGTLDAAEATRFFHAIIKQTDYEARDAEEILDKLTKTMQITAYDMGEIWQSWKSSRAAFGNLRGDFDSFLTMMGMARTSLNPRFAGRMVSQWSSAVLAGFASEGKKGEAFNLLFGDANFEKLSKDPLAVLELASRRSIELWGEGTALRQAKLIQVFGRDPVPMITAYENYMKRSSMSAYDLRAELQKSEGFSAKLMSEIMSTAWGLDEIVKGTKETFRQLLGDVFEPIVKPALVATQRFLAVLIGIIENHPGIVKALGYGVGLTGLLFTVSGTIMLITGQIMSFTGSILNAVIQLGTMGMSVHKMSEAAKRGQVTIGMMLKEMAWGTKENAGLFRRLGVGILKFAAIAGLVYLVWRYDFLRLRTIVTDFFSNLQKAISTSNKQLETLAPEKLHGFIDVLGEGSRWDKFTGFIMKWTLLFQALGEAVEGYRLTGKFTLSNELMAKLVGKSYEEVGALEEIDERTSAFLENLGKILNFIEAWSRFWSGFVSGARNAYTVLDKFFIQPMNTLWDRFWGLLEWFGMIFNVDITRPDLDVWETIGKTLGFVVGAILAIKLGLLGWKLTLGPIVALIGKLGLGSGAAGGATTAGAIVGGAGAGKIIAEAGKTILKKTGKTVTDTVPSPVSLWLQKVGKNIGSKFMGIFGTTGLVKSTKQYFSGQLPKGGGKIAQWLYGSYPEYSAGKVPRLWQNKEMIKKFGLEGMDKRLGYYVRDKGVIGKLSTWLFGKRAYTKAGDYLGTLKPGKLTPLTQYLDDVLLQGKKGIVPSIIRGTNKLGKSLSTFDKFFGVITTTISVIRAPKGQKFQAALANIGGILGWKGGAFLGAKIGTFLTPILGPLGPILGTLIGGVAGSLAGTRIGEAIGKAVCNIFVWLVEEVKNIWGSFIDWLYETLGIKPIKIDNTITEMKYGDKYDNTVAGFFVKQHHKADPSRKSYEEIQIGRGKEMENYYNRHAIGGIFTKPHIGLFAEDGPEAVIPLGSKYRDRALGLWHGVGEIISEPVSPPLGPNKKTSSVPTRSLPSYGGRGQTVSHSSQIVFKEGAIKLSVESLNSPEDIKKGAEELFKEFMKLVQKENMRNYNKVRVV